MTGPSLIGKHHYRGASEARRKSRNTMNQDFSAQALTSKHLPLHGACTERSEWRERVRQTGTYPPCQRRWRVYWCCAPVRQVVRRSGAKINLFQNETYLKHISLTQPLKRDHDQALTRHIAKCNRLATDFLCKEEKVSSGQELV
jgi:hypothetical protein